MPHILFISDLHLSAGHSRVIAAYERFIKCITKETKALYILGDLFEFWAGDDDLHDPFHTQVISALNNIAQKGTRIYLMRGNRDLLMGAALAEAAGATLLDDPTLLDLYGTPTLISHGDTLCIDDIEYQNFRVLAHDAKFQRDFLAQPLAARKTYIEQLRMQSNTAKQNKDSATMDVNDSAVAALLRTHNYPRLIHGHTHRPNHHLHIVDGHTCDRWVLSDWDQKASALHCDAQGCRPINF